MEWTVRYFLHMADKWNKNSIKDNLSPGAMAYAARQSAIWHGRAASADKDFKLANTGHVRLTM
jgi:hypothetical protein